VGDSVDGFEVGDSVFSWAAHTSHAIMSAEQLTEVPEGVEESVAVFGTLAQIALNGVRLGGITLGECAVIAGVGPVGVLALQIARISGAFPLVAIDLSDDRLQIASDHGADHTINPKGQDPVAELSRITKARMVDVVYDVTGSPSFTPEGLRFLRKAGRMVILGSPRGPTTVDLHEEVHTLGLRIIGAHNAMHPPVETHCNQWTLARDLELFFDLVRAGRLRVDDLVSHRFSWRDAPKAYQLLAEKREETMCLLLDWSR
jgi:2-desacetyl-2-hydroxyethyl bacteriochlorophyllide A dehydrogenase